MTPPFGPLRRLSGRSDPREYECGLCTRRYEDDRLNCPACGSTEIRER